MAFEREVSKVATGIGHIRVILESDVVGSGNEVRYTTRFELVIRFSDGSSKCRSGNLMSQLTPAQKAGLRQFMESLRAGAEDQILPA